MALILRETKGSPLSFGEMDGNLTYLEGLAQQGGDPFPYTGDAVIGGTLNIDFTDTLDAVMGEVDYIASFEGDGRVQGDFIGQTYRDGDLFGYAGLVSGMYIEFDEEDLPLNMWVTNFNDEDTNVSAGCGYGFKDLGGTPLGDGRSIFATPLRIEVPGQEFKIEGYVDRDSAEWEFELSKYVGKDRVSIIAGSGYAGLEFLQDTDDEDGGFIFRDNSSNILLGLLGQYIVSENLLTKQYEDDASAAADGVPEGAFYHTDGVLKIRRPLP
jgi:hypothetical protein